MVRLLLLYRLQITSNEETTVINKPSISTSTKVAPISAIPSTLAHTITDLPAHAPWKAQLPTNADPPETTPTKDQQADHPANIPRKA